jgi:hypothetical protein
MAAIGSGPPVDPDANVADLLQNLNLTAEEEDVAEFSDDEDVGDPVGVEWALVGKVLSPTTVHATTIFRAMKPAWGNPYGLKIRSIGAKEENLFIAEFKFEQDMERVLGGSPWMVGRHALLLQPYDENLKPSEIRFDRMDIWVRLLNLPLGWMNRPRGERAMGLVGMVKKMDVDKDGKASGAYLRARVAIEVAKPLRRGVLLKMKKDVEPEWFDLQYEKLPFYCLSCGIMGHSELECDKPVVRNASGKLPYDIKLRAPEMRKKKTQSFQEAAAESFGSGSSTGSKHSKGSVSKSNEQGSKNPIHENEREEEEEVLSPLKNQASKSDSDTRKATDASRQLFHSKKDESQIILRKRKAKGSGGSSSLTPDLNLPVIDTSALVPAGLVSERVIQLGKTGGEVGANVSEASPKKQKRSKSQTHALSAATAGGSPRRAQ